MKPSSSLLSSLFSSSLTYILCGQLRLLSQARSREVAFSFSHPAHATAAFYFNSSFPSSILVFRCATYITVWKSAE